ncbi:MAG: molecular chaperone GroEL [Flavobacteriaceae bacterium]|nr:molecular chaperone GroEL [Flavobacteriaceae bacterium]|tara:strand:+ start:214 stop:1776 length:1563 start_codon:yes stop_codon:yes gene_type:complete
MSNAIVKNLSFGLNAKDNVFAGITKLTQAVSSTLGASGKCVMLEDGAGQPIITKDGVTVAEAITLLDPVENMGATLLKQAAKKTVTEAGDGTTTATVLAHAILEEAYDLNSESTRDIKEGIELATKKVIKYLEDVSIPVTGDMIDQVATISTNNDPKLGKIIADAFRAVDQTGVVMLEVSDLPETKFEIIDGVQYNRGLKNIHFVTNQDTKTAELDKPLVLIVESQVENVRKIQNVLEYAIKNKRSLLIIADVDTQVMSALAMNKIKGNIKVNVIDAPIYGVNKKETLEDLALLTGATVINEDLGDDIDLIQPEQLGECIKSISSEHETILHTHEANEEVNGLIKEIKAKLKTAKHGTIVINNEKRLARLSGKVAVVKVGANSEVELKEKRDRIEDAICATKAAIKEGIVPGGGIALLNAAQNIKLDNKYENILLEAVKSPFNIILRNAGIENYDMQELHEIGEGVNVVTGNMVNMIESGIIDPLLVTKSALKNAASVATTILSTDCVINNLRINEGNRE